MVSVLQQYFGSSKLTNSPVDQATITSPKPTVPAKDIASKWLEQFNHAITSRDAEAVADLFQDDGIQYYGFFNKKLGGEMHLGCPGSSMYTIRPSESRM
jgi:hypothetical protein